LLEDERERESTSAGYTPWMRVRAKTETQGAIPE